MASAGPHSDKSNSELRLEYSFDDETPPSVAIIRAIAIIENTQQTDLANEYGLTLYDHIDPEALDRLVTADTRGKITINLDLQFEHDYIVQIQDTGQLVVQKSA